MCNIELDFAMGLGPIQVFVDNSAGQNLHSSSISGKAIELHIDSSTCRFPIIVERVVY